MSAALIVSAALMGLAAIPHCALMCSAPCAAVAPRPADQWTFQLARLLSYAAAGALAAGVVGTLREASTLTQSVRPVWTMLQSGVLALGLWLLVTGQLPAWLGRLGVPGSARRWGPGAGLLWAAWPCGLLQAALLTASLADHPLGGALAMATFALTSGPGLLWAPALFRRLRGVQNGQWAIRLAGASLVLAALWALGHGLWARFIEWCGIAS
ncbi:sulfite exporter TauE/SafE family protein [Inhella sp. 4Y17]|uniref:Sulfite exporter TauE/SafE family protein n=1 Tax=Inhella gelatinilytica TaxID=2795030 RepID=A0A931NG10_9BURK|nr:sulfite exporter TauE/SafE family protein [Inhella gelatinilytica]